jgi:hypothetical protein
MQAVRCLGFVLFVCTLLSTISSQINRNLSGGCCGKAMCMNWCIMFLEYAYRKSWCPPSSWHCIALCRIHCIIKPTLLMCIRGIRHVTAGRHLSEDVRLMVSCF